MKIDENKDIASVDQKVNNYINSLLLEANKQTLANRSTNILNYVIYLLLNKDFQHILRSFRLCLGMPIDGFQNDKEINQWEAKFRETVSKYHQNQTINKGTKFLLTEIEKTLGRKLIDKSSKESIQVISIPDNTILTIGQYIYQFLKLRNTKNMVFWIVITKELLLLNNPENIVHHLNKWSKVFGAESITFKQENCRNKMTITLYPDTTIKDIEQLIEKKRKMIAEEIKKLKIYSRNNESKSDNIERDYFIYKIYTSHRSTRKRSEKIDQNIRKEDKVANRAEEVLTGSKQTAVTNMKWEPMRKVVSRINKRIKMTMPMSRTEIDKLIGPINQ